MYFVGGGFGCVDGVRLQTMNLQFSIMRLHVFSAYLEFDSETQSHDKKRRGSFSRSAVGLASVCFRNKVLRLLLFPPAPAGLFFISKSPSELERLAAPQRGADKLALNCRVVDSEPE